MKVKIVFVKNLNKKKSWSAILTIVLLRFIFLTVEQRESVDAKTLGGMFRSETEKMKDITLLE
jgi:hypothetical protein